MNSIVKLCQFKKECPEFKEQHEKLEVPGIIEEENKAAMSDYARIYGMKESFNHYIDKVEQATLRFGQLLKYLLKNRQVISLSTDQISHDSLRSEIETFNKKLRGFKSLTNSDKDSFVAQFTQDLEKLLSQDLVLKEDLEDLVSMSKKFEIDQSIEMSQESDDINYDTDLSEESYSEDSNNVETLKKPSFFASCGRKFGIALKTHPVLTSLALLSGMFLVSAIIIHFLDKLIFNSSYEACSVSSSQDITNPGLINYSACKACEASHRSIR